MMNVFTNISIFKSDKLEMIFCDEGKTGGGIMHDGLDDVKAIGDLFGDFFGDLFGDFFGDLFGDCFTIAN